MQELLLNAGFWSALTSLAWPAVAVFLLIRFQPFIGSLLRRENMQIKVGGFELSVQEAAKNAGKDIADLQQRLAKLEVDYSKEGFSPGQTVEKKSLESTISRRLLWVDDFPSNNAFLVENLKQQEVDVVLSLNTDDAMQRLEVDEFSAIITDLGRYENGLERPYAGLDIINKVRATGNKIPILVFAGSRGMKSKEKLLAAGADEVSDSGVQVLSFVERHLGLL